MSPHKTGIASKNIRRRIAVSYEDSLARITNKSHNCTYTTSTIEIRIHDAYIFNFHFAFRIRIKNRTKQTDIIIFAIGKQCINCRFIEKEAR